jgi:hypothetical protein
VLQHLGINVLEKLPKQQGMRLRFPMISSETRVVARVYEGEKEKGRRWVRTGGKRTEPSGSAEEEASRAVGSTREAPW